MGFFLIALIIAAIVLSVISFVLRPRPKKAKPREFQELESPTAGEGHFIPVVDGTIEVKAPNVLFFAEKNTYVYKTTAT